MSEPSQVRQKIIEWVADSVDAIPDDVMMAASIHEMDEAIRSAGKPSVAAACARAIMAERERCAAIADKIVAENNTGFGFDSHPAYSAAWRISAAIRKGEA